MVIGELFINLGIKGNDKTIGALKEVEEKLQGLESSPSELKLGAKGAEQTIGALKQIGSGLKEVNTLLGDVNHNFGALDAALPKGSSESLAKVIPIKDFSNKFAVGDAASPLGKNAKQTKKDLADVLDIKGKDKTVGSLKTLGGELKNLSAMSFEAKAAIIAAMYAFEQLFAKSGAAGTALSNFNAVTGVSTKTLQQYEYAARQIGVSNEETASTFSALQAAMTKTFLGQGAPAGMAQIHALIGGFTRQDVDKYMQNPDLLLQKLQEYAQKEKRLGIRNQNLKSFGLGDNMIAALSKNAFRPEVMNKAPIYSEGAIKSLDQARAMWANLGQTIEMAVGSLNAAHGGQIVKDFGILVNIGIKLADVILKVVERLKLFEGIDYLFKKIEQSADGVVKTIGTLGDAIGDLLKNGALIDSLKVPFDHIFESINKMFPVLQKNLITIVELASKAGLLESIGKVFSELIDGALKFADVLGKLIAVVIEAGEKLKVFEAIGNVLQHFFKGLDAMLGGISTVLDKLSALMEGKTSAQSLEKEALDFLGKIPTAFAGLISGANSGVYGPAKNDKAPDKLKATGPATLGAVETPTVPVDAVVSSIDLSKISGNVIFDPKGFIYAPNLKLVTPNAPLLTSASQWTPKQTNNYGGATGGNVQNINIDQDLHFPGGSNDPQKAGNHMKKAVGDAFRQLSSQKQGS